LNHTDAVMVVLLFSRVEFTDYIHDCQIRQTQADVGMSWQFNTLQLDFLYAVGVEVPESKLGKRSFLVILQKNWPIR
jgi:hypothetical protein